MSKHKYTVLIKTGSDHAGTMPPFPIECDSYIYDVLTQPFLEIRVNGKKHLYNISEIHSVIENATENEPATA